MYVTFLLRNSWIDLADFLLASSSLREGFQQINSLSGIQFFRKFGKIIFDTKFVSKLIRCQSVSLEGVKPLQSSIIKPNRHKLTSVAIWPILSLMSLIHPTNILAEIRVCFPVDDSWLQEQMLQHVGGLGIPKNSGNSSG